jgi:acetone carboxylase gamma subunit
MRMSSTLELRGSGGARKVCCAHCGHALGPAGAPWKPHAALKEQPIGALGPTFRLEDRVRLREFSCPGCLRLLDTELALEGDPFLDDILFV